MKMVWLFSGGRDREVERIQYRSDLLWQALYDAYDASAELPKDFPSFRCLAMYVLPLLTVGHPVCL